MSKSIPMHCLHLNNTPIPVFKKHPPPLECPSFTIASSVLFWLDFTFFFNSYKIHILPCMLTTFIRVWPPWITGKDSSWCLSLPYHCTTLLFYLCGNPLFPCLDNEAAANQQICSKGTKKVTAAFQIQPMQRKQMQWQQQIQWEG